RQPSGTRRCRPDVRQGNAAGRTVAAWRDPVGRNPVRLPGGHPRPGRRPLRVGSAGRRGLTMTLVLRHAAQLVGVTGAAERRRAGSTYQQIAAAGGGILSTVRAVRSASRAELVALARPRLERLLSFGVTTVEVKSGYGLSLADELRCLEAIAELNQAGPFEL